MTDHAFRAPIWGDVVYVGVVVGSVAALVAGTQAFSTYLQPILDRIS